MITAFLITIVFVAGSFIGFLINHDKKRKNDLHNTRTQRKESHNI